MTDNADDADDADNTLRPLRRAALDQILAVALARYKHAATTLAYALKRHYAPPQGVAESVVEVADLVEAATWHRLRPEPLDPCDHCARHFPPSELFDGACANCLDVLELKPPKS